jgi:hypothetical protein
LDRSDAIVLPAPSGEEKDPRSFGARVLRDSSC